MRRLVPFYPLLLATFPVIFLASQNPYEVTLPQILGVLLIVLIGSSILTLGFRIFMRNDAEASALASVLVIAFFSYGHILDGVWGFASATVPFFEAVRWRYFVLFITLLGCAGVAGSFWVILRYKGAIDAPIRYLGVAILVLLLLNSGKLAIHYFQAINGPEVRNSQVVDAAGKGDTKSLSYPEGGLPDIYYIILDGYARADVLKEVHNFNNSEFLGSLQQKGFYIAEQSRANYIHTRLSLPSSMNMRYLDDDEIELGQLSQLFINNEVMRLAKALGYDVVHFDSQWRFTAGNPRADVEVRPPRGFWRETLLSDFSESLLNTTAARFLDTKVSRFFSADYVEVFHYTVDKLSYDIPEMPEPTFTFVHFKTPHPPYFFDRNGHVLTKTKDNPQTKYDWHLKDLYVDEVIYLNSVVEAFVDDIIARSRTEPVIIIQGDHGTAASHDLSLGGFDNNLSDLFIFERTGILNAYYLPEYCRSGLYPSISPVNTFRIVYSKCLGIDLSPLEDKSYFYRKSPTAGFFEVANDFSY